MFKASSGLHLHLCRKWCLKQQQWAVVKDMYCSYGGLKFGSQTHTGQLTTPGLADALHIYPHPCVNKHAHTYTQNTHNKINLKK